MSTAGIGPAVGAGASMASGVLAWALQGGERNALTGC